MESETGSMRCFIAGDLGGTNCRMMMIKVDPDGSDHVIFEQKYKSKDYAHLVLILQTFIREACSKEISPTMASIAVAGPVTENRFAEITNLNWTLDAVEMAAALHLDEVYLMNDFAAIGFGLLGLDPSDTIKLNESQPIPLAPIACLGAGTGLGEVFLTHNGQDYNVWASEGGHTDFAPRTSLEFELMEFIKCRSGIDRVSVERVVSGAGLPDIYKFFKHKHSDLVSQTVEDEYRKGGDPAEIITRNALEATDVLCQQAFQTWLAAYGAEAGNLALKTLCYGGLYIAGGIAPKIPNSFTQPNTFYQNMCNKGRMKEILQSIPVYVVTRDDVGMLGARVYGDRRTRARRGV